MSKAHSHHHEHDHPSWQKVKLLTKEQVAKGTMAFYFEKPANFAFRAGNHLDMKLIDPPETDAEGNTRHFSLACTPQDDTIRIATRMRDTAFKRVLGSLETGSEVNIGVPHGSYVLHDDMHKPAVFLIGGIGITAALSIIKDATERHLPHQMTLLYSNRSLEEAAFMDELQVLANANPNFSFVPTMTRPELAADWQGETGRVNEAMIKKYVPNIQNAVVYISGPPQMVAEMHSLATGMGTGEDCIRTEEFTGY